MAANTDLPITGYVLEWDNGTGGGAFVEIWSGRDRADVLAHTQTATTGVKYSLRYKAINANGDSSYSDVFEAYACEAPSAPGAPTWVTSTTASISLSWTLSTDDGGCPVIGYGLFRDAGDGSAATTTQIHTTELASDPTANGLVVTSLPTAGLGNPFVFKLKVYTAYTQLVLGDGVSGPNS